MVPFNLGLNPDKWLEERIQLFFDYCYPSVKSQSRREFRWVVFFDSRTPKGYLDRISANDSEGILEYLFTDHWNKIDGEILSFLEKEDSDFDQLISTRLDCDDALSEKFVQTIQKEVSQRTCNGPYALNCSNGVILDVESKIYYKKMMRSNPFISLVQKRDQIDKSIFGLEHQEISDQIITIELKDPKMWLQVVHGGNLINKSSGLPLAKNLGIEFNIVVRNYGDKFKPIDLALAYFKYIKVRSNNLSFKIKKAIGL